MSEVVNETLKWWRKFIGKDVLLSTSKTKLFVSINNLTLPHLLGLHYCYKESRYVSANRILKELENLSDNDIFHLVNKNNPKMLASVRERIATFKSFMEHLEKAYLVENTHPVSKLRSDQLLIETKDGKYMHLGLLSTNAGMILNDFGIVESKELETYILSDKNTYFRNSSVMEKLKKIECYEGEKLVPFSFDEKKQRQYDLAKKEKLTVKEKPSIRAKIKDYQEKESIKERDKPLKQVKHEKEQEL